LLEVHVFGVALSLIFRCTFMAPQLSAQPLLPLIAEGTDFQLRAQDGYRLAARLWAVQAILPIDYVALINAGAGIRSQYYDRFARFLAEMGIPTLVYDYRGIGSSRPSSLRRFQASVEEWGSKDCAAALQWLATQYPEAKRIVIGHSIGGFVTGFVTNGALIDRMLMVSAHTGYWRDYSTRARPLMFLLWHVFMPAITQFVGYFPGRRLHLLEDLPKGVALEWAARRKPDFWWHLRLADGSPNLTLINSLHARFASINGTMLALRFTDDPFATSAATERILGLYKNASAEQMSLRPSDWGGGRIGHFGFFRSRFRSTLWPMVLNALLALKKHAPPQGNAKQTMRTNP
jgi:predicted alpha/beta hydrolase